jgi:hypothetical protein
LGFGREHDLLAVSPIESLESVFSTKGRTMTTAINNEIVSVEIEELEAKTAPSSNASFLD